MSYWQEKSMIRQREREREIQSSLKSSRSFEGFIRSSLVALKSCAAIKLAVEVWDTTRALTFKTTPWNFEQASQAFWPGTVLSWCYASGWGNLKPNLRRRENRESTYGGYFFVILTTEDIILFSIWNVQQIRMSPNCTNKRTLIIESRYHFSKTFPK